MNGCKACKHNIKDADIYNLKACDQCIFQASNFFSNFFCKFPQEKARRGPPPRQTNQRAINNITINESDNNGNGSSSNNNNKNNIIINNDNNLLVSPCDSIISTFSPIPSLSPSNVQYFYIPSPPNTPSFNRFCEAALFDCSNKESSMVLNNNDDSLFHEFFFEEPISDGSDNKLLNNNDDIINNNNDDDNNNNDSNNNNDKNNNKLSPLLLSMATTPAVTIPTATIPTTTSVMTGIVNCTSTQLHSSPYIYILQPQDFVPCEHPPSTEMDPLLGLTQAPPSIFAQEGTEESAPQASGIATRKMTSSPSYENFVRSSTFFL
jgi:hypothetical protein